MSVVAIAQHKRERDALAEAKRILFLGNSITYAGGYVSLFESYLITQWPHRSTEVINQALPSETVSGLSEPNHADGEFPRPCLFSRLDRVLSKTKADVVFVCYGMNDGIYLPFDEVRFAAYTTGMQRLYDRLCATGVKRIFILTPPVHDDPEQGLNGYNLVLDRYAAWLLDQREKQGWEVIDTHFPMRVYLAERKKTNPAFKLADDGVHPGTEGHWLIAKAMMSYFGETITDETTSESYLTTHPLMAQVHEAVSKRQQVMKDAWLTYTGHERPGMTKGLPMAEAKKIYSRIGEQISLLVN